MAKECVFNMVENIKKPNILFIMVDQMRYDSLGCNGNAVIKTPNIDRLARMGVNFGNSYTPSPICVPARASLTTGFYPHKCTGIKDNDGPIKPGFPLIGEELSKRNYKTYTMGKLHYLPYTGSGEKRTTYGIETTELCESGRIVAQYDPECKLTGLEDYLDYLKTVGWGGYSRGNGMGNNDVYPATSSIPEEHFVDTWITNRSIYHMEKHLEEYPDKPFFMWTSFPKPHSAYDPPRPYDSMYDPREMPEPAGSIENIKKNGLDLLYNEHKRFMWDKLSVECKKQIKANYYGLISLQDKLIGRMIEFLENRGILNDTLIIYTTDHGDMLGDHGLFFKRVFYNSSVKIPLIISYPKKIPGNQKCQYLVGLQDLLPTICGLTGEQLDVNTDGIDLSPILQNYKAKPVRQYYVSQCNDGREQQYMITDGVWKFIYTAYGAVEELYNIDSDPSELDNLIHSKDEEAAKVALCLKEELTGWCLNNEDNQIINGGQLLKMDRMKLDVPDIPNPFGRRLY